MLIIDLHICDCAKVCKDINSVLLIDKLTSEDICVRRINTRVRYMNDRGMRKNSLEPEREYDKG